MSGSAILGWRPAERDANSDLDDSLPAAVAPTISMTVPACSAATSRPFSGNCNGLRQGGWAGESRSAGPIDEGRTRELAGGTGLLW